MRRTASGWQEISWSEAYDDAIRIYEQVLAADPDNTEARLGLARVVAWNGDLDRAEQIYDAVLEEQPRNRDAVMGKIQIIHWGGRPLGANRKGATEDAAPPKPTAKNETPNKRPGS